MNDDVKFFKTKAELRKWFEKNHEKLDEQWIGFWKKGSGKPSVTWPEVVDVALCFGWIDGIVKTIDADSYRQRLTPRRPRSIWSAINIKRVGDLIESGEMTPAGMAAFEKREESRSAIYTYEKEPVELSDEFLAKFKKNKKAWAFFQIQPAGYQRLAKFWVMTAKQNTTRLRRMETLISDSEAGLRLAQFRR